MDPTQALIDLLRGIDNQDRRRCVDACEALGEWLQGGGFYPQLRKAIERAGLSGIDVNDCRPDSSAARCLDCGRGGRQHEMDCPKMR